MAKALILGCSHAAGAELKMPDAGFFSYPALIAKKLGYVVENKSQSGGSNDAMFRIFESEFKNLQKNDIVIACWTGINRTEFFDEDTKEFLKVNLGSKFDNRRQAALDNWVMFQSNEILCRLNKIKNILALNFLAQSRDLQIINIHSFWPTHDFTFPDSVMFPIGTENFWDWSSEKEYTKTRNGHFDVDAHSAFAEYILSKL